MRLPVTVIVVGNLTAGGTGKTPLVAWLAQVLKEAGMQVGISCRGYGALGAGQIRKVTSSDRASDVGDEALLLAEACGCAVIAGPDRVRAVRRLAEVEGCGIVICDDGLQHLRLARDIEICVVDGMRRFGNGRCLPAGPLREPVSRLSEVHAVVVNGGHAIGDEVPMRLVPGAPRSLLQPLRTLESWQPAGAPVHAVAGIGNPTRFFDMLRVLGIACVEHPFPDHHAYRVEDLDFGDDALVLMTEKDAVKCREFAREGWWSVPVRADLPASFRRQILDLVSAVHHGS